MGARSIVATMLASIVACSRPQHSDVPSPDPSTKPLPTATTTAAPPPQPPDDTIGGHVCEPVVECGFWSKCVWLEKIDATHYRAVGGAVTKGVYVRRHQCQSVDASTICAVHCTGVDGGAPCVDGLHPEMEECTESAPPSPDATPCPIGNGICGSLL
jgi:hypothetical protein